MLKRLQTLSNHNIVHGDIHPGNFLFGKDFNDNSSLYLIDFGKSIVLSEDGLSFNLHSNEENDFIHEFPSTNKTAMKTTQNQYLNFNDDVCLGFSTANILRGNNSTYRDDVESLAFTIAYLLTGTLPSWCNFDFILNQYKELYGDVVSYDDDILRDFISQAIIRKQTCSIDDLCGAYSSSAIAEFVSVILQHARLLSWNDKADFDMLFTALNRIKNELSEEIEDDHQHKFEWLKEGIHWSHVDGSLVYDTYD
jgi:serine/threonine protein kinase